MSHHLKAVEHVDEHMQRCIAACSDCHDSCVATIEHCLNAGDEHAWPHRIRALADCAQACDASRDFMLRGSGLHHRFCDACAEACERCAESCERIGDDVMRQCAEICRRCAESCRQMGRAAA